MADYFSLSPDELKIFLEEAQESVQTLEDGLLALEKTDPAQAADRISEIFRAAHTIKGSAATAGFEGMARLTHAMENLLDGLRHGAIQYDSPLADALLNGVDFLRGMLAALQQGEEPSLDVEDALAHLVRVGEDSRPFIRLPESDSPLPLPESGRLFRVEVEAARDCPMPSIRCYQVWMILDQAVEVLRTEPDLDTLEQEEGGRGLTLWVRQEGESEDLRRLLAEVPELGRLDIEPAGGEEGGGQGQDGAARNGEGPTGTAKAGVFAAPSANGHSNRKAEPAEGTEPASWGEKSRNAGSGGSGRLSLGQTIRVDVALLDTLLNLVGELVIDRTRLGRLVTDGLLAGTATGEELNRLAGHLTRVTTDLQDEIMRARMLPVENLFKKFPRLVRDLTLTSNKDIEFSMSGQETELDRSVIDAIGDPLIHLLRNAVDHGIEAPAGRRAAGKPLRGRIELSAYHQENHIIIRVGDDGKGLDVDALREKAVQQGLLTEEHSRRIDDSEAVELIFEPGLSTARQISEVSGRGVGMDVVRRNIEGVNGSIEVETEKGRGTTFTIKLPLTLAIQQALMVELGGTTWAIPLGTVSEVVELRKGQIQTVNTRPVFRLRDTVVPLFDPRQAFGEAAPLLVEREHLPVVVVTVGGSQVGLAVDRLLGEQEVVIKGLGSYLGEVTGVSGATILGDGSVALIMDVGPLVKAFKRQAA